MKFKTETTIKYECLYCNNNFKIPYNKKKDINIKRKINYFFGKNSKPRKIYICLICKKTMRKWQKKIKY